MTKPIDSAERRRIDELIADAESWRCDFCGGGYGDCFGGLDCRGGDESNDPDDYPEAHADGPRDPFPFRNAAALPLPEESAR